MTLRPWRVLWKTHAKKSPSGGARLVVEEFGGGVVRIEPRTLSVYVARSGGERVSVVTRLRRDAKRARKRGCAAHLAVAEIQHGLHLIDRASFRQVVIQLVCANQ